MGLSHAEISIKVDSDYLGTGCSENIWTHHRGGNRRSVTVIQYAEKNHSL
jgi:hypothetical protein